MLTTRPQPLSIIPGKSAVISAMGVSMLASSALMKILPRPVRPQAGRRAARVGHQDVDIARSLQHARAAVLVGDVGGDGGHAHPVCVADRLCRRLQAPRRRARSAPARRRPPPAPPAQTAAKALGRCADKRAFSRNPEIHVTFPLFRRLIRPSSPMPDPPALTQQAARPTEREAMPQTKDPMHTLAPLFRFSVYPSSAVRAPDRRERGRCDRAGRCGPCPATPTASRATRRRNG